MGRIPIDSPQKMRLRAEIHPASFVNKDAQFEWVVFGYVDGRWPTPVTSVWCGEISHPEYIHEIPRGTEAFVDSPSRYISPKFVYIIMKANDICMHITRLATLTSS